MHRPRIRMSKECCLSERKTLKEGQIIKDFYDNKLGCLGFILQAFEGF